MRGSGTAEYRSESKRRSSVRPALIAMALTSVVAFVLVANGAVMIAHVIARRTALAEAEHAAQSIVDTVFAPSLMAALNGDRDSKARLDRVVATRSRDGSVVRIKVWRADGTVIYSDDPRAVGMKFPPGDDIIGAIERQQSKSDISDLKSPENVTEIGKFSRLVEVYTPITLPDGSHLAFETYSTDARLVAAESGLTAQLVPFALSALLVLLITQLPISMWLVRRVGHAREEHSRLLRNSLIASARERRTIARDLHDGVVQDLAGVGYAVGALAKSNDTATTPVSRRTLDKVSTAVQDAIGKLRTLMVDIYPPDLSADGLHAAIEGLAEPLRSQNAEVDVRIDLLAEPSPDVAATLYRCAREGLANVAKHAQAKNVTLTLGGDADIVEIELSDDGVGMPETGINGRGEGHFGLQLLRDVAVDLGGEMHVASEPGSGTTLTMWLPMSPILTWQQGSREPG